MSTVQEVLQALDAVVMDVSSSEAKGDPNMRFIADLKCNMSPYFNACGLIQAIPVLTSSSMSLQRLVDVVAASKSDSKLQDRIDLLKKLARGHAQILEKLPAQMRSISESMNSSERIAASIINDLESDFAKGLVNPSRNASLTSATLKAVDDIEHLANDVDDWLNLHASLLNGLSESPGEDAAAGSHTLMDELLRISTKKAMTEQRFELARSSIGQLFDIMSRNQRRFDILNQTRLKGLTAMHALMVGSSIKSGYAPVSTTMHVSIAALSKKLVVDTEHEKTIRTEVARLLVPGTEISQQFHDPGYLNSPFFNVTLTFFLSHLINGADRGLDIEGLRDAPNLLPLLEDLRAEAGLTESEASKVLDESIVGVLAVLAEVSNDLGGSTGARGSSVPLEKIENWRLRVERNLHSAARFATALATIPVVSINTPEFSSKAEPASPSMPGSTVDPYSFLTLNQYRIHTDHRSVLNSLNLHKRAQKQRNATASHLKALTATFDSFNVSSGAFEDVQKLIANALLLSAYIRRQVIQLRALVHTLHALCDTWLCCKTNGPDREVQDGVPDGPFMREMMFVSAYMAKSVMELVQEISATYVDADEKFANKASKSEASRSTERTEDQVKWALAEEMAEEAVQPYLDNLQQRLQGIERVFDVLRENHVALEEKTLDAIIAGAEIGYAANCDGLAPEFFPTPEEILA